MNIEDFFNSARSKSLATVNENGEPNICLCGTALMGDDKTIEIGNVCMDKIYDNVMRTKKATLMAVKPTDLAYWDHFEKTGEKLYPAGYRLYCSLINESHDTENVQRAHDRLQAVV